MRNTSPNRYHNYVNMNQQDTPLLHVLVCCPCIQSSVALNPRYTSSEISTSRSMNASLTLCVTCTLRRVGTGACRTGHVRALHGLFQLRNPCKGSHHVATNCKRAASLVSSQTPPPISGRERLSSPRSMLMM